MALDSGGAQEAGPSAGAPDSVQVVSLLGSLNGSYGRPEAGHADRAWAQAAPGPVVGGADEEVQNALKNAAPVVKEAMAALEAVLGFMSAAQALGPGWLRVPSSRPLRPLNSSRVNTLKQLKRRVASGRARAEEVAAGLRQRAQHAILAQLQAEHGPPPIDVINLNSDDEDHHHQAPSSMTQKCHGQAGPSSAARAGTSAAATAAGPSQSLHDQAQAGPQRPQIKSEVKSDPGAGGIEGLKPDPDSPQQQQQEQQLSPEELLHALVDCAAQLEALAWGLSRAQPEIDDAAEEAELHAAQAAPPPLPPVPTDPKATFTCPVCLDDEVCVQDAFVVGACGHRLCRPCALRTVGYNIKNLQPQVCPTCSGAPCPRCPITSWAQLSAVAERRAARAHERAPPAAPAPPPWQGRLLGAEGLRRPLRRRGGPVTRGGFSPRGAGGAGGLRQAASADLGGANAWLGEAEEQQEDEGVAWMQFLAQLEQQDQAAGAHGQQHRLHADNLGDEEDGDGMEPRRMSLQRVRMPGGRDGAMQLVLEEDEGEEGGEGLGGPGQQRLGGEGGAGAGAGGGAGGAAAAGPPAVPAIPPAPKVKHCVMSQGDMLLLLQPEELQKQQLQRPRKAKAAQGAAGASGTAGAGSSSRKRRGSVSQTPSSTKRRRTRASVRAAAAAGEDGDEGQEVVDLVEEHEEAEQEEEAEPMGEQEDLPPTYEAYLRAEMLRNAHAEGLFKLCPKCGEGVDMGTEEVHLVCPTCGADQCVACGCDWHKGSTCEQYQQWLKENAKADEEFEKLRAAGQFKPCPKCGAACEKISGCDHVVCANKTCKTAFCYRCGKVKTGHEVQSHACSCMNNRAYPEDYLREYWRHRGQHDDRDAAHAAARAALAAAEAARGAGRAGGGAAAAAADRLGGMQRVQEAADAARAVIEAIERQQRPAAPARRQGRAGAAGAAGGPGGAQEQEQELEQELDRAWARARGAMHAAARRHPGLGVAERRAGRAVADDPLERAMGGLGAMLPQLPMPPMPLMPHFPAMPPMPAMPAMPPMPAMPAIPLMPMPVFPPPMGLGAGQGGPQAHGAAGGAGPRAPQQQQMAVMQGGAAHRAAQRRGQRSAQQQAQQGQGHGREQPGGRRGAGRAAAAAAAGAAGGGAQRGEGGGDYDPAAGAAGRRARR